jgi:hypothetical protein
VVEERIAGDPAAVSVAVALAASAGRAVAMVSVIVVPTPRTARLTRVASFILLLKLRVHRAVGRTTSD